uniref:uncharacterized protein n=1 Tax=Myxine glutinosa TaxID=7769 RepID=UPI00358F5696
MGFLGNRSDVWTMVKADVQSEWSDVGRCVHRCSSSVHYNLDNDEKVGKERRPKGNPYCLWPSGPGELGVVLKGTGHIRSTPTLCAYSSCLQGDVTSDGESHVDSAGPGEPSSWAGSACGSAHQGTRQYSMQPNPARKFVSSAGRHPRNHRWQRSKFHFRRSACSPRLERHSRSRSRSPLTQVTRCGVDHGVSQEISHRQDLEIPVEQISSGLECLGEKEEAVDVIIIRRY